MRLLMTTDAVGGVWRYSLDAARALEARGYRVSLAVIGPDPSTVQQAEAAGLHLIATGLPLDWAGADRAALARAARELAALAEGYDAVQLNQPAFASLASWPAPVLAAAHSCVATWWGAVEPAAALPENLQWQADLTRDGLTAARATIAPSEAFAAALACTHGLADAPTAIHNGRAPSPRSAALRIPPPVRGRVDLAATPPSPEPGEGQAEGQGEGRSLVAVGRLWDRGKNMALLDALAPLIGLPVHLYGDVHGPNSERFTAAYATLHGHVGSVELDRVLAARPVFAAPSFYEPFGLAVLEAAQAGCALVLADIPTFRELWDGAAVFADPRDAASWLPAIARARRDAETLGAAARVRAGRYTVDRMADRLATVLESLAA